MYERGKRWKILLFGFGSGILFMLIVFWFIKGDKAEAFGEIEETEQISEPTETKLRDTEKASEAEQSEIKQSEATEEMDAEAFMAGANMTVPESFVEDLLLYEYIEYGLRKYNEANRQDTEYACDIEEDILPYNTVLAMRNEGDEPFKTDLAKEMIPELSNRIFHFKLNGQEDSLYMRIDTYNMKIYVYDMLEK